MSIVRRDTLVKERVALDRVEVRARELLEEVQTNLLRRAERRLEERSRFVANKEGFKREIEAGNFVLCFFAGGSKIEAAIQTETTATARLVVEGELRSRLPERGRCPWSGGETDEIVLFAKSY